MRTSTSINLANRFSKLWCLLAGSTLAVLLCPPHPVKAQTVLPSFPGLNFQTSGPSRDAGVGDWYTTNQAGKTGGYQSHRFFVNITEADIAAANGSLTISIIDAGSNGPRDEVDGGLIGTGGANPDPTRFQLLGPTGAIISSQIPPNGTPAAPSNISFPPITIPGVYTITSETGASPISGDATPSLNDDDNGFQISIPGVTNLLIGQLFGTFQQDTGGAITVPFYAFVPPSSTNLFLRNFDLDNGGTVTYTSPTGVVTAGTNSDNAVWNNGGDLNNGGDSIPVAGLANTGIWTITLNNYTSNNQALLQANLGTAPGLPIPLFDRPPTRAGNFTITPDTTRATSIGTAVDHPFTVRNNFFTSDVVNLVPTGTNGNYTAVLLTSAGNPLPDTDGNGVPDTGFLAPGQTGNFILRVTPNPGAPAQDVTQINGTSFLDARVRQQSNSPPPTPQSVTKTTTITSGNQGPGLRLVKRITDVTRNGASIAGLDFNTIQDDPSTLDDNAPGWAQIPLRGQIRITGNSQIRTGDEVTYTVYFLSDGGTPAFGTNLCDQIPTGTSLVANTAQIQLNNTAPTSGGTPFSPLAPLPAGNACQNQSNPTGSVIFGLGDLPNTAGNNFGLVRFRVRIN